MDKVRRIDVQDNKYLAYNIPRRNGNQKLVLPRYGVDRGKSLYVDGVHLNREQTTIQRQRSWIPTIDNRQRKRRYVIL